MLWDIIQKAFLPGFTSANPGTDNFILPFMTNVTISISISQSFLSWVAIYQLRPPMASLSHSLYDMPGLAPRMNVLFWGRHDFQISFSNRNKSRSAWNRHLRSFLFDTGILSSNTTFLSHGCLMTFCSLTNKMITFHRSDFMPIRDLFTELDLLPTYEMFPKNIRDGCSMLTGDAYSPGHLVPSHLGLAYVLLVEPILFPDLYFFRTIHFEHPSILSRFCLSHRLWNAHMVHMPTCALGDSLVLRQWHSPGSRNMKRLILKSARYMPY